MKKWYKICRGGVAMALVVAMSGCSNDQERRLDAMVEAQNAECPIEVCDDVVIEKVGRSGNVMVYDVKVEGPNLVKTLGENAEVARRLMADAIAGSDSPEVKDELRVCRDAGATMKYILTDTQGDTFSIEINPADYIR